MEFDTDDSRKEYFQRIEADIEAVEYGAALRHAGSVDLGFFGEEDDLFDDCARIMLAEVNKRAGAKWCRLCDIQHSRWWHLFYESARGTPRNRLAKVYRELYEDTQNEALIEEADRLRSPPGFFGDIPPYEMIFNEIQRKGRL